MIWKKEGWVSEPEWDIEERREKGEKSTQTNGFIDCLFVRAVRPPGSAVLLFQGYFIYRCI